MKMLKTALCLVLVLGLIPVLLACGNEDISGKYHLVSMESDGAVITAEDMKAVLGEDAEMYLELGKDGTGVLNMMGEAAQMAYEDGMIWAVGTEIERIPFTVEDGVLTLSQDGQILIFIK